MTYFDASQKWMILAGAAAKNAAEELACYISLLRQRADCGGGKPLIENAETFSPPDDVPVIILSDGGKSRENNGFAWRLGKNRIEIHGDSPRGLWNAVFDFLAALGFTWPKPGLENHPDGTASDGTSSDGTSAGAYYALKNTNAFAASPAAGSPTPQKRRRLLVKGKTRPKERDTLIRWAARNKIDALIFSLGEKSFWAKAKHASSTIEWYALITEAGGGEISLLVPRHLFFFHRDLFRMDSGKRTVQRHFCPTNPKTTNRIMERAEKLFNRAAAGMTANVIKVFHLWPEDGFENTWCSCPACRAFSPAEQYHIAANTAADALAKVDTAALLSFWTDPAGANDETGSGIAPRKNMFFSQSMVCVTIP